MQCPALDVACRWGESENVESEGVDVSECRQEEREPEGRLGEESSYNVAWAKASTSEESEDVDDNVDTCAEAVGRDEAPWTRRAVSISRSHRSKRISQKKLTHCRTQSKNPHPFPVIRSLPTIPCRPDNEPLGVPQRFAKLSLHFLPSPIEISLGLAHRQLECVSVPDDADAWGEKVVDG